MDDKYTFLKFSIQNYFFVVCSIILTIYGLSMASSFFIPLCFAILLSFILLPTVRFFERKGLNGVLSIILTFLVVISLLSGVSYFFSSQITSIISDFESFKSEFNPLLDRVIAMYNKEFSFLPQLDAPLALRKIEVFLQDSGGKILGTTLTQTTVFVTNMILTPIYVFLFLLYRRGLMRSILMFFKKDQRSEVQAILRDVQSVGKGYLVGLFTVMVILAIINSTFLLIIGIDYAIMFGCLSALLIVIPYVGPFIGGMLPIIYALVTMGSSNAFVIMICFICSHLLESNYLTPKIVGGNTSVNALAAFLSLVLWGTLWGIPGMILAIPFTAMLKRVFSKVAGLRPVALLLGEEIYEAKEMNVGELEYIEEKEKTKFFLYKIFTKISSKKSKE